MIKILIVEDQALLSDMLKDVISAQEDMELSGTTDDAALAPELCKKLKPDLVLMDVITKNNSNGITYAAQIRAEMPDVKIVIMTGLPEITFVEEARKAGVHSFINKDRGKEHLLYVIHNTMQGNGVYPGPADNQPFNAQFNEKEITVIRLVCQGKTRIEIADELAMSEAVVKRIISGILDKTYFDSIMKFAVYAVSRGLIVPDNK
ncbi:MAG: response regulator transcription factor [Treponema sp.]|nr:response regulator transcription factor [Treponema sp.]MCL2237772.1 response regulator transcription factor [Treponema sp.]